VTIKPLQDWTRKLLAARGYTLEELARAANRHPADVRRSLVAPHDWTYGRMADYARALGVPLEVLVTPGTQEKAFRVTLEPIIQHARRRDHDRGLSISVHRRMRA
jgi:hypothetical protein